ncbi:MAG: lipase family protein, partial [Woeseiaceae bacterium]
MTLMSVPDFQNAFDPAHGLDFHKSRAYWLGRCSELVYPVTEEEKEADRKASEAKAAERALNPPWWKPWIRKVKTADCERARAEALAAVSRVVRTEALRVEADVRAWGFNRFQFLSGMSTQCFVAASDNVIVVCFRGTEVNRVGDIYDDLMAIPMRQAQVPGLIHIGFWNALKQVWRDIDTPQLVWPVDQDAESCKGLTDYLREFRNEVNPQLVWITGHSLGGALATMAAARLLGEEVLRPDEIGGVYTFGQPRVGDQMFADAYEIGARHFRVVHDNDVVTRVPPESLKRVLSAASMFVDVQPDQQENAQGLLNLQYSHVGHVAFLSGAAGIVVGLEKWQLLQRRIIARLMAIIRKGALVERLLPGLTDHSMSTYNNLIDADVTRSMLRSTPDERTSSASTLGRSMPDQNDSSLHAAPQNNSGSKLLAVFSGAGIGLLVGLLMGLSVSPTVGLV